MPFRFAGTQQNYIKSIDDDCVASRFPFSYVTRVYTFLVARSSNQNAVVLKRKRKDSGDSAIFIKEVKDQHTAPDELDVTLSFAYVQLS